MIPGQHTDPGLKQKKSQQCHMVAEATSLEPVCSRQSLPHFPAPTSFGVHGAPGHQTAFHQGVGVVAHDLTILTGPWFAFVGIHHQVLRPVNRTAPRQISVHIYMSLANTHPCIRVYKKKLHTLSTGAGKAQGVECVSDRKARRNTDVGSSPQRGKGFFFQSQLPVQTPLRCLCTTTVCNRMPQHL